VTKSDGLIVVGHRALPWVVGPAVLILRARHVEIVPPSRCPGLLEITSIAAVRLRPGLHIGTVFDLLQGLAITVGLATFIALAFRTTQRMTVAVATGLAVGVSPLFAPNLAPGSDAAAFAVCAAGAVAGDALTGQRRRRAGVYLGAGAILLAASIVPSWSMLAALGAGMIVWVSVLRVGFAARLWAAGATAAGVLALTFAVLGLSPPNALSGSPSVRTIAPCLLPLQPGTAAHARAAIASVGECGPFALALLVLGVFVEVRRSGWKSIALVAIGTGCLMLAAIGVADSHVASAPVAVAVWRLIAIGLAEVVGSAAAVPGRHAAASALLCLMPVLQVARIGMDERDDWQRPQGHERVTLPHIAAMLNVVAANARLVEEDATVDVLLRAAVFGGRRARKPFMVIRDDPDVVRQAMEVGAVYAFPHSQVELSQRGFSIEPVAVTISQSDRRRQTIEGLAAVTALRPCQIVGDSWRDLEGGAGSGWLSLAADAEWVRGPVTIYLGGSTAAEPRPDGWPPRTIPGFQFSVFDQSREDRSEQLRSRARHDGVPEGHAVMTAPFVQVITLQRTPRAPLALAVALGAPFPIGLARLERPGAEAGHLMLCDAPATSIRPLGVRVE
jgi:hypothetical protein